jgi:hypothetical protein
MRPQVAPHNGIGGDVSQLLHALLGGPGKYIRNPAVSEPGTLAGAAIRTEITNGSRNRRE